MSLRDATGRFAGSSRWFGGLARDDPERAVVELRKTLDRVDGRLVLAAAALGLCRRQLYRYVWQLDAWGTVNAARDRAAKRGNVPRGLARLRMELGARRVRVA